MRRRADVDNAPPQRLRELSVDDWCPGDPSAAMVAWREARRQWADVRGWPGGELVMGQEELAAAISLPDERWR